MIWSLALAAVGVLGLYLSGKKNYWGWGIGLGAQVLWIVYAVVTQQWGFIISALAYGWVYGKNFLSWRNDPDPAEVMREAEHQAWLLGMKAGYYFGTSKSNVPRNPYPRAALHNGKKPR